MLLHVTVIMEHARKISPTECKTRRYKIMRRLLALRKLTDEEVAHVFGVSSWHVCNLKKQFSQDCVHAISPPRAPKTPAKVAAIHSFRTEIHADPHRSIIDMARECGVSETVGKRVVTEDLGMKSRQQKKQETKIDEAGQGQTSIEVQETREHSETGKRPMLV